MHVCVCVCVCVYIRAHVAQTHLIGTIGRPVGIVDPRCKQASKQASKKWVGTTS